MLLPRTFEITVDVIGAFSRFFSVAGDSPKSFENALLRRVLFSEACLSPGATFASLFVVNALLLSILVVLKGSYPTLALP